MFFNMVLYGEIAKIKQQILSHCSPYRENLKVFTVKGKAIELKSMICRFEACSPHKIPSVLVAGG
jgi:hypothetical protein